MNDKLVSVIIPVYNSEIYIRDTILSIIKQSYNNMEILVIDDGSTDRSLEILNDLALIDSRIKVISRENRGLISTLNELISLSKGVYIARADSDDLYKSDRIEHQVKYLIDNPDIAVVGSSYKIINEKGQIISSRKQFSDSEMLRAGLLFGSPLAHPSVMFNRSLCERELYYHAGYMHAEDYELWVRLVYKNQLKISNIPKELFSYRIHSKSISSLFKDEQSESMVKALLDHNTSRNFNDTTLRSAIEKEKLISINDIFFLTLRFSSPGFFNKIKFLIRVFIAQFTKLKFKLRLVRVYR